MERKLTFKLKLVSTENILKGYIRERGDVQDGSVGKSAFGQDW